MAEGEDTIIPTHGGTPPQCPDCFHGPHFRTACKQPNCWCPSGIERKRQRDAEHVAGHGDSRRPSEGFY